MKNKLYLFLNVLLAIAAAGFLVYFVLVEKDNRRTLEAVVLLVGSVANLFRIKAKRSSGGNYAMYEDAYKDIISGAFAEDKKSYKKLLEAIVCYNKNEYKSAHKLLKNLEKKCIRAKDYDAVHMFHALCYDAEGNKGEAINYYNKALQYNAGNSRAWSNLGHCYKEIGQEEASYKAYSNALLYDSQNAYAHINMSVYYIDTNEPGKALEHALKAVELNANIPQAMSAAAVSYMMLDDEENAKKYCRMYQLNGGDINALLYRLEMIKEEKQEAMEEEQEE